ncbi:MAG: acetoacetyl-CoA reductase [Lysobacteraceae bacterium]|jgi:acetoacetyl-CoA reductase
MDCKRLAVVTGGIGGLGTAICARLSRQHRVIAVDLPGRDEAVAAFHAALDGRDVHFMPADVGDFDDCARLVANIEAHHGPLDVLVNAAGITRDATLRKMTRAQWDAVLGVDLHSVFNLCRQVVDGMCTRGYGRIVNISSVNAQTGQFGQTNYAAAKAGMHGFSMSLARETARYGVTVNSVAPGYIDTTMTRAIREDIRQQIIAGIPVGRMGQPDDIARVVDFLCAEDAGYLTGALIPVNGGQFMSF